MDKRISYKIVLDTETCPLDRELDEVTPSNMFAYDIGWAIVDKRGNVYKTRSFINADIFLNEKIAMTSAYYADKIPKYWEDYKNGTRILTSFYNIRKTFLEDIAEYNVKQVFAHNMRFDYGVLNNTQRWLTKSKYRYFFPKGIEIWDSLKASRSVIAKMPTYQKFCKEHGYMTKHKKPQVKLTAETLYRFITKNTNFSESHTGLEDVLIELEIYKYCKRQKKKMEIKLF